MNGNLKRAREIKALSRQDLAHRSGVDASTIYRAEQGKTKMRPSTIRKLARALELQTEELASRQTKLII